MRPTFKANLGSSWESLSFGTILRIVGIPSLIIGVLFGLEGAWRLRSPFVVSSLQHTLIVAGLFIVLYGLLTIFVLRKVQASRSQLSVIIGFAGLIAGLIAAIIKCIVLFKVWTLFRLIAEPALAAIIATIIGELVAINLQKLQRQS